MFINLIVLIHTTNNNNSGTLAHGKKIIKQNIKQIKTRKNIQIFLKKEKKG